MAGESAAAEARAAGAALRAVEAGIALYAERRDYLKLKDIAEASDVAGKVWLFATLLCLVLSACNLMQVYTTPSLTCPSACLGTQ